MFRLLFSPFRLGFFFGRLFGYHRIAIFLIGVVVGLLLAPATGRELRDKLRAEVEKRQAGGGPPGVASPS